MSSGIFLKQDFSFCLESSSAVALMSVYIVYWGWVNRLFVLFL